MMRRILRQQQRDTERERQRQQQEDDFEKERMRREIERLTRDLAAERERMRQEEEARAEAQRRQHARQSSAKEREEAEEKKSSEDSSKDASKPPHHSDLYDILEVACDADEPTIKKSFRRLSRKMHPDRGGNHDDYCKLSDAFAILSDPKKRKVYDKYGKDGLDKLEKNMRGGSSPSRSPSRNSPSGASEKKKKKKKKPGRKMRPSVVRLEISLDDAFKGKDMAVTIPTRSACKHCNATGMIGLMPCTLCSGIGVENIRAFDRFTSEFVHVQRQCKGCEGHGIVAEGHCEVCDGEGICVRDSTFTVCVPPGAQNGQRIRVENVGDLLPGFDERGDVLAVLVEVPHPKLLYEAATTCFCANQLK